MSTKPDSWWTIKKAGANSYRTDIEFGGAGSYRRALLLADAHWDNAHCRLDLLKRTLDVAKAEGAPVYHFGDWFCAMQGAWDQRKSRDALRDEHHTGSYLDSLVSTAAEWLEPYAANIALMSYGNHETSIKRKHEVDLLQRLCHELRRMGSPVECGPYWGFVTLNGAWAKHRDCVRLHYHHGYGGGGEVSRGVNQHAAARSMYDADIFVSGHIHRRNLDENVMTRVSACGVVQHRRQLFLRCSTYKDESGDGWHVAQGRAARPLGGWWLNLVAARGQSSYQIDYSASAT
jgi:UDP-2,3-diacylglucosamine pyrophosphatase LpxH